VTRRISTVAARRVTLAVLAVLAASIVLTACGGGADSLGHQACLHVSTSIHDYEAASRTADPATRERLSKTAATELSKAEPLAALAASSSGDWEALGATLGEAANNGIPESNLITALSAQCAETLGCG
jgi:hypothetical protein